MARLRDTGRNPTAEDLANAKRIASLPKEVQREHPSALPADHNKLAHVNTYGWLPDFYIDKEIKGNADA